MTSASRHVHSGRILYLDGWRGLAISLVLLGHLLPDDPYGIGLAGVELFFVLSGRLMADVLFVERFPLREFFWRRFSRVYPGLLAFVLVAWAASSSSPYAFKPAAAGAALTFTINYAMVFGHGVEFIENLWSLCIEEHAYVLLAVIAWFARRRGVSARSAILLLAGASLADAVICSAVLGQSYRTVYWRTDAHIASILLGAAGYLLLRGRQLSPWVPAAALLAALPLIPTAPAVFYTLGTAFLAVSVCTLDQAPRALQQAFSLRPLRWMGMWSYSLYLWQQPFYRLKLDGHLSTWETLAALFACGLASYQFVEQPARKRLNALWKSRARRAREAPGAVTALTP